MLLRENPSETLFIVAYFNSHLLKNKHPKQIQLLFEAEDADKHKYTSDLTSQHWFTARSSLTYASTKTPAFEEQLGFILTTNPVMILSAIKKKIQEFQTDRGGLSCVQIGK